MHGCIDGGLLIGVHFTARELGAEVPSVGFRNHMRYKRCLHFFLQQQVKIHLLKPRVTHYLLPPIAT